MPASSPPPSFRLFDKLPRTGKAQFADLVAGNHPRQHFHATIHIESMNFRKRAVVADVFLDEQLVVCKGGNLRCVGDAQHLAAIGEAAQHRRDRVRGVPTDARVDLVNGTMTNNFTESPR